MKLFLADKELDIIEMAVYGDVIRPGNQCRCRTVAEMLGRVKSKNPLAACELPYKETSWHAVATSLFICSSIRRTEHSMNFCCYLLLYWKIISSSFMSCFLFWRKKNVATEHNLSTVLQQHSRIKHISSAVSTMQCMIHLFWQPQARISSEVPMLLGMFIKFPYPMCFECPWYNKKACCYSFKSPVCC